MDIGRVKAAKISEITIDDDVDFLTLYQAKRLASPASGEALRKGSAEITMAELAAAIKNLAGGIAVLDASADVPLAQIPDTLTGKDAGSVGGDSLATIEGTMDSKIAAAGHATLTLCDTEVFAGDSPATAAWTDLVCTAVVGANKALIFFRVTTATPARIAFRMNGETEILANSEGGLAYAVSKLAQTPDVGTAIGLASAAGVVEWHDSGTSVATVIDIIGYIK